MDLSVNLRFIENSSWKRNRGYPSGSEQSMENQTTYHVSAGAGMQDTLRHLQWEGMCFFGGRIQSREYVKRISENQSEKRIAYEVSVSKLEYVD